MPRTTLSSYHAIRGCGLLEYIYQVEKVEEVELSIAMDPIGFVRTDAKRIPRHWTVSDVAGTLVINAKYLEGLKDIKPRQRIVVIFHFHQSPDFDASHLIQTPPHRKKPLGVFSICSPVRPNPIGMSVLEVLGIENNIITVKGLDMLDGTPILDIKPCIINRDDCPSFSGRGRGANP
jgi:tRNA-Thr(GGU) m(6)t(6)A37 methyltransferase TsaA